MTGNRFALRAVATAALVASVAAAAAAAQVAGTNGKIVFRRYFDDSHQSGALFSVNPDGSGLRQITHPPKGIVDDEPVWSPDSKRIAFEFDHGSQSRVYLVDADGTGLKPLAACTGGCAGQDAPAWSPDGSKIAMGSGSLRKEEVWIVNANGTGLEQLTQRGDPNGNPGMDDDMAAWSPDGTKVAFVRHLAQPQPHGRTAIFVIGTDGSGERQLTSWALNAGDHPDWSPDGTRILFRSNSRSGPAGAPSNIYTIGADGTRVTQLTHARVGTGYLSSSFSPDGKWITFGMSRGTGKKQTAAVYVMRTNGTGIRAVTKSKLWDSAPDWGSRP
jgi:Tol biopolymer transport system component